jgi:hypothetical protein
MLQADQIACIIEAAEKYEVPANLLLAIAEKEGGSIGQYVGNSNGTYDVGPMQFNSGYLKMLSKYGITEATVAAPGCFPYQLAAWRVRGHIHNDSGDLWTRAANYHSRTARFNQIYRADLVVKAEKWLQWLQARYPLDVRQTRTGNPKPKTQINAKRATRLSTRVSTYVPRMIWQTGKGDR